MLRYYPSLVFFQGHRDFKVAPVDFPGIIGEGDLDQAKDAARAALQAHLDAIDDHTALPFPTSIEVMPYKVQSAEADSWCLIKVSTRVTDNSVTQKQETPSQEKPNVPGNKGKKKKFRGRPA